MNEQPKMIDTDQVAFSVSAITGISIDEVHAFVAAQPIKYSDLLEFVRHTGNMPDDKQCTYIGNYGIDPMIQFL